MFGKRAFLRGLIDVWVCSTKGDLKFARCVVLLSGKVSEVCWMSGFAQQGQLQFAGFLDLPTERVSEVC